MSYALTTAMDRSFSPDVGEETLSEESGGSIPLVVTELYDVIRQDISFKEKVQQTLDIGSDYLHVDKGYLTRIDGETDHWEALISTDSPEIQFPPNRELDLETTYCRRVLDSSSQVALHDAPAQGWDNDPAYKAHQLHSYIGTPLQVNDEQYGTVFFAAEDPRDIPYSDDEKILVELISHMLEGELERNQYEAQLAKETNLSLVLNRVLRQNLRNEMSVIRDNTQRMAANLPESDADLDSLQRIDRLIKLCEKARELDSIVASDTERNRANIRAIVEQEVAGVRSEYPSASISIDADDEVTGAVFPSLKQAVRELIENAAKHNGNRPTINLTVESVPNAVEITIADDGTGLADQEIEVLRSGSETPLMHGAGLGLWLVHWIVSHHDGSIEASATEAGTTLTITVPRTPLAEGNEQVSELVRARDQHKAAFDEAGDGMIIIDDEARILDVNKEVGKIFGVDKQKLLGRSIQDFLSDDFDFEVEWNKILSADRKRDKVTVVSGDGRESTVEYTSKTNVVPGQHLMVMRDITDWVDREGELKYSSIFD